MEDVIKTRKAENGAPPKEAQVQEGEFMPLREFMEQSPATQNFPYPTSLSFRPFLDRLENGDLNIIHEGTKKKLESHLAQLKKLDRNLDESQHWGEYQDALEFVLCLLFPPFTHERFMGFVSAPFSTRFFYRTPSMKNVLEKGQLDVKILYNISEDLSMVSLLQSTSLILKTFYDYDLQLSPNELFMLKDRESGLEKYFQIKVNPDFIKVNALKPPPPLTQEQIQELVNNFDNREMWLKHLPPDHFSLEGFVFGEVIEITDLEILSRIKEKIVDSGAIHNPGDLLDFLQLQLSSFLELPQLRLGVIPTADFLEWDSAFSYFSLLHSDQKTIANHPASLENGLYCRAVRNKGPFLISDLEKFSHKDEWTQILIQNGIRSLILCPLANENGKVLGMLELGAPQANTFHALTLYKLKEVIPLLAISFGRKAQQKEDMINLVMQQKFTAIHPSVQWKFKQAAREFQVPEEFRTFKDPSDALLFRDLHPLYGQADIVSSSTLRNQAIQADLIENLTELSALITSCLEVLPYQLLDAYLIQVKGNLARIRKSFNSSDESQIVELLAYEIHPFLKQLAEKYSAEVGEQINAYFTHLDKHLNVLYHKRKSYEDSVQMVNQAIAGYLEEEQEKMQKLLPHYFEMYRTDGVEYNLYLGQDILREGTFSPYYLKNFRLWQLASMCEITRLVKKLEKDLSTPLSTAQLIFVYNTPLSIRFRMDEKQFDVDGAYNVRYEIIKKRIDKAIIKGSDERLTQAGKIAIVYLQQKDRQEYLEYLDYLIAKGYISPEIEDLELEKLPGADGLRALRVSVQGER
jgi:GAF domain-containing protein